VLLLQVIKKCFNASEAKAAKFSQNKMEAGGLLFWNQKTKIENLILI